MEVTEEKFKEALGLFPTGVVVITCQKYRGQDVGITVSSFSSVSLAPPQILFCLSKSSRTMLAFAESNYFTVNILSASQKLISENFARRVFLESVIVNTFQDIKTNCFLIKDALSHIICEKGNVYDEGDHLIILGKVQRVSIGPKNLPLIRHSREYLTTKSLVSEE